MKPSFTFDELYQERLELLRDLKVKFQQKNTAKRHLKGWNYRIFLQNVRDRKHDAVAGHSYNPMTDRYTWAF
jgi:hypothetical protein